MQDNEFGSIWVGLEINWFSPKKQVSASTWVPSKVVASFFNQDVVLTLKLPFIKRKLVFQEIMSEKSCSNVI